MIRNGQKSPGPSQGTFEVQYVADLVDRFFLFVAPKVLGGGIPTLDGLTLDRMDEALTFSAHTWETVESDLLFRGYRHGV